MGGSGTLGNIRLCAFDAYGTLFDVHSAVARHRERLGESADAVSQLWRTKQLEYTWLRSLMGRYADFWAVTGDALDHALAVCGVSDPPLREDLMGAYLALDCYPDVRPCLESVRARGLKTAILSNGSPDMLRAAVDGAGLANSLDDVISVDEIRIYKPDPRVYSLACERFGVSPAEVSFQSSNAWDVAGAAAFGLKVVWINRFGQTPERLPAGADRELPTLEDLASLYA